MLSEKYFVWSEKHDPKTVVNLLHGVGIVGFFRTTEKMSRSYFTKEIPLGTIGIMIETSEWDLMENLVCMFDRFDLKFQRILLIEALGKSANELFKKEKENDLYS